MQTKTQEKGAVTPRETDPDLAVRSRCLQQSHGSAVACCTQWEALSGAVQAWDLLKVTIIFITSTKVWPQETTGREHSPTHQQKIGLKIS